MVGDIFYVVCVVLELSDSFNWFLGCLFGNWER